VNCRSSFRRLFVGIPKSSNNCVVSLKARGSVEAAGFLDAYSRSIVLPTGFAGLRNGGLGFVYRSKKALRGLSGSWCCFSRGVDTVLRSLSKSPLRPDFGPSIGENRLWTPPKSERDADRAWDEGLCSSEERSLSSTIALFFEYTGRSKSFKSS